MNFADILQNQEILSRDVEIDCLPQNTSRAITAFGFLKFLVFIGIFLQCSACGPSLGSTIPVPTVSVNGKGASAEQSGGATSLYIDQFVDSRESKALAKIDRQEALPAGDVVPAVVEGLKKALQAKGFAFTDSAPVIISGEVRQRFADVTGNLPTKVDANAAVFIEVLDPANKRIYSGVYKGFASMEAGSVNEDDVKNTLANAMGEAVTQVAADKQLLNLLSSY